MIWTDKEFNKLRKSDSKALIKFYEAYKDKVYKFLLIKAKGDASLADELLSDTYHSAIENISKLKHKKNILAWLFQIAYRRFNDYLRKLYKEKKLQESFSGEDNFYEEDHVENLHKKEVAHILQVVLDNMKPEHNQIIKMKYIDGKTFKEISEKTGIHLKNVQSIHYRAKALLVKQVMQIIETDYKHLLNDKTKLAVLNSNIVSLLIFLYFSYYFIN